MILQKYSNYFVAFTVIVQLYLKSIAVLHKPNNIMIDSFNTNGLGLTLPTTTTSQLFPTTKKTQIFLIKKQPQLIIIILFILVFIQKNF